MNSKFQPHTWKKVVKQGRWWPHKGDKNLTKNFHGLHDQTTVWNIKDAAPGVVDVGLFSIKHKIEKIIIATGFFFLVLKCEN